MIQTQNIDLDYVLTTVSSPRGGRYARERAIIRDAVSLLEAKLTPEQALNFDQMWDALDDEPGEYSVGVLTDERKKPVTVVAYTPLKDIPGTQNTTRKPATAGTIWYLVTEQGHALQTEFVLSKVIQEHNELAARAGTRSDLGILADTVTNAMDAYSVKGFKTLPFVIYVPSLEDGREKVIEDTAQFLIRPGERYRAAVPAGLMKQWAGSYLWGGYASPSTGEPYKETMRAINAASVKGNRGLVVPF